MAKRKKQQKKPQGKKMQDAPLKPKSLLVHLYQKWSAKSPILLFVIGFAVIMFFFYLGISSQLNIEHIQPFIASCNAQFAHVILNILGQETFVSGTSISSSTFSINVAYGCDAIEPCAIFAALILAFPVSFKLKIKGLLLGILALLSLNQIRIISLFLVGKYYRAGFDVMHEDVWQIIFILFAVICWGFWIQWSFKKQKNHEAH